MIVDGTTYINEWHLATNSNTYTATFNLTGGSHTFTIEYYEAGGNAFIDYHLSRTGVNAPAPSNPGVNTGTTATITTARLNVRNAPNTGERFCSKLIRVRPILSWVQMLIKAGGRSM